MYVKYTPFHGNFDLLSNLTPSDAKFVRYPSSPFLPSVALCAPPIKKRRTTTRLSYA